jgi:Immunity protein 50
VIPSSYLAGSELLVQALGYWPSFHDAEVVSFSAERALPVETGYSVARMCVHVRQYESVGTGTAQFQMVLRKSVLARFVFTAACDFELSDFNHQNVINSIEISAIPGSSELSDLHVEIESIWGFGGSLRCSSAAIETVENLLHAEA